MSRTTTRALAGSSLAAVLILLLAVAAAPAQADDLQWRTTDGTLALEQAGQTVWQFNYADGERKPNFHPVNLPGIGTLTWKSPPDHAWHIALWFSWKYINDLNYWEEDRQTGKPEGVTAWRDVKVTAKEDHSARVEMLLAYHPPGEKPVLTEKRLLEIAPPDAHGAYRIDWECTFTAGNAAVELDRTPLPGEPGGKDWGGYAGLSVRFAEALVDWKAVDSDGTIREQAERIRTQARAVDYSGTIDGRPCGIAIFDHPQNMPPGEAPTPWYIIQNSQRPMAYFSPAVIQQGPRTIPAGESITLRYRVLVHPGRLDAAALKAELGRYVK